LSVLVPSRLTLASEYSVFYQIYQRVSNGCTVVVEASSRHFTVDFA